MPFSMIFYDPFTYPCDSLLRPPGNFLLINDPFTTHLQTQIEEDKAAVPSRQAEWRARLSPFH